jgi:hypothetical protein
MLQVRALVCAKWICALKLGVASPFFLNEYAFGPYYALKIGSTNDFINYITFLH